MLVNRFQQRIKRIICNDESELISNNSCSTSIKYVSVMHYINNLMKKTCMVDIINAEEEFDKIHQQFLIANKKNENQVKLLKCHKD